MFQFPPQSPLTHVVTQHPSELFLSSNHIYNTDPPSISTTPSIPLPHPPIQPPFCLCVPNTITYQRCLKVMEGRAILNLADVRSMRIHVVTWFCRHFISLFYFFVTFFPTFFNPILYVPFHPSHHSSFPPISPLHSFT